MAVNRFTVTPRFGELPDPALLNADLRRILAGTLELDERLRAKESTYRRAGPAETRPPRLLWFDDEATDATVLEVRAPGRDRPAALGNRGAGAVRRRHPLGPDLIARLVRGGRVLPDRRRRQAADRGAAEHRSSSAMTEALAS